MAARASVPAAWRRWRRLSRWELCAEEAALFVARAVACWQVVLEEEALLGAPASDAALGGGSSSFPPA